VIDEIGGISSIQSRLLQERNCGVIIAVLQRLEGVFIVHAAIVD
jgi:hypothetical protein